MTDLSGMRFGRWTVLERAPSEGEARWKCRCDCGAERIVLGRNLRSGASLSCGCLNRERRHESLKKNLAGKRFGKLLVLEEADAERTGGCRWKCVCDCGRECIVSAQSLQAGKRTSCGCDRRTGKCRARNVAGQRFGRLIAEYPTEKRRSQGSVIWHCRCDCGGAAEVSLDRLQSGAVKSCGCMREQCDQALAKTLVHVAGTSIDILRSEKCRSDNATGVRGVFMKRGKFAVRIGFQGKSYYLGSYDALKEATAVRRRAEERLHESAVQFYDAWKRMADQNAEWARENPIRIQVERCADGEFSVKMAPDIPY